MTTSRKIQVIAYLTEVADHVRVISHCPNMFGVISDPRRAVNATEAARWDALERMVLGVIMFTA